MKKIAVFIFCNSFTLFVLAQNYGLMSESGSIFKANEFGTPVEKLYTFDTVNGSKPMGGLVNLENRLYGRTVEGGINNSGVLFYYDLLSNEYASVLHLDSSYLSTWVSPLQFYNGNYYGTNFKSGESSKFVRVDFTNPNISTLDVFENKYAYFGATIINTIAYIPTDEITSSDKSVLYKYDLLNEEYIDSLILIDTIHGKGSIQCVKENDSTLYIISSSGAQNGFGSIVKANLNTWNLETQLSFDSITKFFSQGIYHDNKLYFFGYNNGFVTSTLYKYENQSLMELVTFPSNYNPIDRPSIPSIIGNNLVFIASNISYRYSLISQELSILSSVNSSEYGFGAYMNELIHVSFANLESEENLSVSVYPNPTKSSVNVNLNSQNSTLKIFDSKGQLLKQERILTPNSQVDLVNFENGIYYFEIEINGEKEYKRIIKL